MRQAMKTLKTFTEKDREYDRYQARQNFLRVQSCDRKEKEEILEKYEEAKKERDEAQAKIKQLEALLAKQSNVDDSKP